MIAPLRLTGLAGRLGPGGGPPGEPPGEKMIQKY